jgi:putative phosphoesterase
MSQVVKKRSLRGNQQTVDIIRIGVLADTHLSGCAAAFPLRAVEDLKNMDAIIHAGDLVDLRVIAQLKELCPQVIAVRGNMDLAEVRDSLPEKEIVLAGKYKIGLTHGYGNPSTLLEFVAGVFQDEKVDIVIFGHSHNPLNKWKNGILYFNPGSLTDKVFAQYNSYGIIELNDKIKARIVRL